MYSSLNWEFFLGVISENHYGKLKCSKIKIQAKDEEMAVSSFITTGYPIWYDSHVATDNGSPTSTGNHTAL